MRQRNSARAARLRVGLGVCLISTGIATAAPAPAAAMATMTMAGESGDQRVDYGERVRMTGQVDPNAPVSLEHAPRGSSWREVESTTADAEGRYEFVVKPRQSGSYRAVDATGTATKPRRVTVEADVAGKVRRHALGVDPIRVRGRLDPGVAGRRVRLEVRHGGGWKLVDRTTTRKGGAFRARFDPTAPGAYRLRVRFVGDRLYAGESRLLRKVYVYMPGGASWYGPGFYGNTTACGQTFDGSVKGVAHRYLPCGTRVRFYYRGRSVTARVIDRGPYHGSRSWDLSPATKSALGFPDTGTVWAAY